MAKISIIVPVYNTEKYLKKCLNSLKDQTLKDIEIIVVNDGTKDNSQKIIDEFVKKDNRFKSFIKKNGGLSDARNYGLKKACSDFIAFVDSDDYVDKLMYEKMYDKITKENLDIVECDFIWEYDNKKVIDKTRINENDLTEFRVVAWNKLIRRNILIDNNIEFTKNVRYEDVDFTYKLLAVTNKIGSVNESFYNYIQRNDSIANTQNEKVKDIFIVLDNVIKFYKEKNIYEENKDKIEYLYLRILLGSSFKRICKIKDKKLKKDILKENWDFLNERFPNWKKNSILKTKNNFKNLYYKIINKMIYKIFSVLYGGI